MKILITGANGFLGQHLCRSLKHSYKIVATGRSACRIPFDDIEYYECDITDIEAVTKMMLATSPDGVIHTAAMSKPDECVLMPGRCIEINVNATRNLVGASGELNKQVHFIYVSSDFVMGDNGPHTEDAMPAPLNFYGETKLMGEKIVRESDLLYSIVRPVFMYGETWQGMRPTFLHWVKQNLEAGKPIKVVADQQRTPTYVGDICKGIAAIIGKKAAGLYHLSGEEVLSPYDMALAFAKENGLDTSLVKAVTSETFPEPVQRAKRGGLVIEKARALLNFDPLPFSQGLQLVNKTFTG